jgi:catechol-2,3-dioxygenase
MIYANLAKFENDLDAHIHECNRLQLRVKRLREAADYAQNVLGVDLTTAQKNAGIAALGVTAVQSSFDTAKATFLANTQL